MPVGRPLEPGNIILDQLKFRQLNTKAQIEQSASKMFVMAVSFILFWLALRSEFSIYEFYWSAAVLVVVLIR